MGQDLPVSRLMIGSHRPCLNHHLPQGILRGHRRNCRPFVLFVSFVVISPAPLSSERHKLNRTTERLECPGESLAVVDFGNVQRVEHQFISVCCSVMVRLVFDDAVIRSVVILSHHHHPHPFAIEILTF